LLCSSFSCRLLSLNWKRILGSSLSLTMSPKAAVRALKKRKLTADTYEPIRQNKPDVSIPVSPADIDPALMAMFVKQTKDLLVDFGLILEYPGHDHGAHEEARSTSKPLTCWVCLKIFPCPVQQRPTEMETMPKCVVESQEVLVANAKFGGATMLFGMLEDHFRCRANDELYAPGKPAPVSVRELELKAERCVNL